MSALRVGIACFPTLGGSGVIASELATGLARRGHQVHVFATARPSRVHASCERLAFHAVDVPGYPLFQHAPYSLALATRIVDVARETPLDVLHVHYAVPHAASAMLVRQVLGDDAPAIVTSLHGTDVTRVGASPAYRSVTAHAVATSDAITVPSEFLRREAHEKLGLPGSVPVEIVPNFIDTDHFAPPAQRDRGRFAGLFDDPEDGPVLFHVSNFRAVKRPVDLVEVLSRVRKSLPARLVLVGEGPERAAAEERAEELGLRGSTCFLGRRLDFAEHLRHADGFLLTSECESFGVAALEALGAGVPVFAYRVGGLPELIDDSVGRLAEPFDVDALAASLVGILSDPSARESLGRAARERAVGTYRTEPALDRYESLYRRIAAMSRTEP